MGHRIRPLAQERDLLAPVRRARTQRDEQRVRAGTGGKAGFDVEFVRLVSPANVELAQAFRAGWECDRASDRSFRIDERHEIRVVLYQRDAAGNAREAGTGAYMTGTIG